MQSILVCLRSEKRCEDIYGVCLIYSCTKWWWIEYIQWNCWVSTKVTDKQISFTESGPVHSYRWPRWSLRTQAFERHYGASLSPLPPTWVSRWQTQEWGAVPCLAISPHGEMSRSEAPLLPMLLGGSRQQKRTKGLSPHLASSPCREMVGSGVNSLHHLLILIFRILFYLFTNLKGRKLLSSFFFPVILNADPPPFS